MAARVSGASQADCPDYESALQACGRHVSKEVLVGRPGLPGLELCGGSVVLRLNDSIRRDMSRNGPRGLSESVQTRVPWKWEEQWCAGEKITFV